MSIVAGQALLFQAFFANGVECSYKRPFLVIENTGSVLRMLNVSSVKNKAHKLVMPSNKRIYPFKPPFSNSSFVKLDELYEMEYFLELDNAILASGQTLNSTVLQNIQSSFYTYSTTNRVENVNFSKEEILARNSDLILKSVAPTKEDPPL
jgi:hypothetical protein